MSLAQEKYKAWFVDEIEVPQETRHILERYSGVAPEDIVEHVEVVRHNAFSVVPYPCIGQGKFLNVNLSKHPLYSEILSRVRTGHTLIDIGSCFGTDLRKLIMDGASPQHLYGIDLEQAFLDQGCALYRDKDRLPSTALIAEDMLDPDVSEKLQPLLSNIDIVYMSSFLHVFDINEQLMAVRKALKLLRKKPGSLIVGRQIGNIHAGPYKKRVAQHPSSSYYHNVASFDAFMRILGAETNTIWHVESTFDDETFVPKGISTEQMEKRYPWLYEGCRGIRFAARLAEVLD